MTLSPMKSTNYPIELLTEKARIGVGFQREAGVALEARKENEMEWQPIASVPKDGSLVDLWIDGQRHPDCRWYSDCSDWGQEPHWVQRYAECGPETAFPLERTPSHWMPLPLPPELDE